MIATVEARITATGEIITGIVTPQTCGGVHVYADHRHGAYERGELDWVRELVRADQLRPGDLTEWNRETVQVVCPWDAGALQVEWRNPDTCAFDGYGGEFWPEVQRHARMVRFDRDSASLVHA